MKKTTKEMKLELLEGKIIQIKHRDNCKEFTFEDTLNVIEKIDELCHLNNEPKGSLTYVAPFYINKKILNHYVDNVNEFLIASALICPTFASRYVAKLVIKLGERSPTYKNRGIPTRIFSEEEEAIDWLRELIRTSK